MEKIVIKAEKRTIRGKQVGQLRRQGKLPAVIYGRHIEESLSVTLDLREATRALHGLSSSTIVTLDLDGKEYPTLVREKQRDYIMNVLRHVDFQAVSLTEKISARVELVFDGVAPAVKDYNGLVVDNMSEIEVEALPQDLPERIHVDISGLKKIGDAIHVKEIKVGDKVQVLSNLDEIVVVITTSGEEEVAAVEEGAVSAEPEVIEKGKKEEEEIGD
ncbi:MAG: 50S ribosomal protein L25 [Anaerolineae bacterium]|nr:50S ribosomal protein L25 [Anaerolineae bacterium]